ncbi:hypothetical protein FJZ18_04785 [Candidatus Pacearchaeota archaeon]|nr:hypothetical protein [Candidatus Pacearchaeota archaeon]
MGAIFIFLPLIIFTNILLAIGFFYVSKKKERQNIWSKSSLIVEIITIGIVIVSWIGGIILVKGEGMLGILYIVLDTLLYGGIFALLLLIIGLFERKASS